MQVLAQNACRRVTFLFAPETGTAAQNGIKVTSLLEVHHWHKLVKTESLKKATILIFKGVHKAKIIGLI
jgi:hypothetical protein